MEQILDKQKAKQKVSPPKKWKVIFLNDDFTPMDFVIVALVQIFNKSNEEAYKLMMDVHEKGRGIAGIYPKDVAQTKQTHTIDFARQNEFPLQVIIEEE